MTPILVISSLLLSLFLILALIEWAEVFVSWKKKRQEQHFHNMVEQYKTAIANKDEITSEQQYWIEDMKRLLSLNALSDEQISKLSKLDIVAQEEIEKAKSTQSPTYSFKRVTFIISFTPLLTIAFTTVFALSSISIMAVVYATTSIMTIIVMLFLGIIDQKSHMIPLEVVTPALVVSICYVLTIILTRICPITWVFIGFCISVAVFAIPYIWLLRTKNIKSFGKGDLLVLPSYSLIIAPYPIAGLLGTIISMLISILIRFISKTPDKRMPMGPFLSLGASLSVVSLMLLCCWF